jgi:hypothetical protein
MRKLLFKDWIREQADLHSVDGCTGVTNWNAHCCLVHDLEFKFGKRAASAYQRYLQSAIDPWAGAEPVTFEQANDHFKACNFRESTAGYLNPFAWLRYAGMRLRKTRAAWDGHRAKETQASV